MKRVIVFSLLTVFVLTASAQDFKRIRLGFRAIPTFSWIKPDVQNVESDGMVARIGYGVNGEFYFSPNYAFATGFAVQYTGGKLEYPAIVNSVIGEINRRYYFQDLEIPLAIKMKTNEIGYMTYFGTFGLAAGFNLKAKADETFTTPTKKEFQDDLDVKSDISFIKTSLILGLGTEYNIAGNTSIYAGVSFINGFTDVLRGKTADGKDLKGYTKCLELSLGIMF